jgi:hypothetical protein
MEGLSFSKLWPPSKKENFVRTVSNGLGQTAKARLRVSRSCYPQYFPCFRYASELELADKAATATAEKIIFRQWLKWWARQGSNL